MKPTTNELYSKITTLSKEVQIEFLRRGFVIPAKNADGTIKVGHYIIKKNCNDFYMITDHENNVIVDYINLPHTAAVLANELALGYDIDKKILDEDREYGYAEFEDQMFKHSVKSNKSPDYMDILRSKFQDSKGKKEAYKKAILARFEKLNKIV